MFALTLKSLGLRAEDSLTSSQDIHGRLGDVATVSDRQDVDAGETERYVRSSNYTWMHYEEAKTELVRSGVSAAGQSSLKSPSMYSGLAC